MAPIPRGGTVAVTGSAGFIGGWVVRYLLERGYRVRACVRDAQDESRTAFLKDMPGYASGRLTLHSADLDQDGCFDEVFAGCHGVCHVSHVSDYNDHGYVRRVCTHVIRSVERAKTVSRVVLTSSIAAVIADGDIHELGRRPVLYEDRYPDEDHPKRTVKRGHGYSMGKVIAERSFAEAAEASGQWDAITCCPGDNVGPIQSAHQMERGPWQRLIAMMLRGKCYQNDAYRPWMTVDVRDTATCHIDLLASSKVKNGERYIAWSTETRNVEDVCASIGRVLPEIHHKAPPVIDPFPDRIKAREAELRALWAGCELRNDRMRAVSDVRFRPLDDSIRDCVESLMAIGGVQPKRPD